MARKELRPEDVTVIVDNREQRPWNLAQLKMQRGTLYSGDYGILGLNDVALERKTLFDLLGVIGKHRDRFEHELARLAAIPSKAVIVEASFQELAAGRWQEKGVYPWQSRMNPKAAMGSVLGWIGQGIPFLFAGDASNASLCASRFLFIAAKRRFRELSSFQETLKLSS